MGFSISFCKMKCSKNIRESDLSCETNEVFLQEGGWAKKAKYSFFCTVTPSTPPQKHCAPPCNFSPRCYEKLLGEVATPKGRDI